ncbi:MAG: Asp-tRNA(Asn)/Glu-tRNA(Gln) amidotransferase subunit GatA [Blastocatellia bacterium]|nr:Asp-tRNA(Asn)/Glu-tRNA(Gln) amidotransferase subunit GatA [Blastocatellia bacterium]MCS7158351.1 Asp-tRNA(Asn)/Glu-tRNA(Gln) amidotransferase subunit GatA [Blastocatellia bacterium]MCX7752857.1 Asp-tRNA(Asn)/Glu-tRNA(Gln) amidotransferase subunit GatA [Blastocatellia bacterium]MDW8167913.1 Asp-tRNA(Asn)/Glu-tRNA(Gln) amidotransferase subunit GatA [Acidobacteriota bacterium]MDW8255938.1 Asp-tRNA(Asn)/Glu-tRNA(Gln) amidotransferase subunit GatA [Acidobacteriota bacterium]
MEIVGLTIDRLHEALRARTTSVTEVCRRTLERIEALDPQLGAFLTVNRDEALRRAEELDRDLARGEPLRPLTGVPVAIKDNICTRGLRTTCASKILYNFIPPYNATAVERLLEAGAIIIGKTNCDEFAMGSSNENSAFGIVRNPWDAERVPGGSSGGSGAAVAADLCVVALGSDTGGSVRLPAAFCGVVGVKPTYGRVSRYGLVAYGSSLDQIGPITKTVADAARVLQVIAGRDPRDSTSSNHPVPDYLAALGEEIKGLRLGVPREYFGPGLAEDVRAAVGQAIDRFADLGAEIVEVRLPHTEYAIACYYIIATAEASSNLARYDGVRYGYRAEGARTLREMYRRTRNEGFGAEVKRRIMLGTYVLSAGYYDAYYLKALKVRTLIERDFREAFTRCDLIIGPTSPTVAFRLGEKTEDPLAMYLSDIYTIMANLAGIPAISIPIGLSREGLPIGLQLHARHFEEEMLLRAAHAYEQAFPFSHKPPL